MNGKEGILEWSFDEKSRNQVNFKCCSIVLFNYVFLHWHFGGDCKGVEFPNKFRLRSLEIGRWLMPLKYYVI